MKNKDTGILIVDDEFSVRDSLYNWFKQEGYRVDMAKDANEAMQKLGAARWDIILLDIKMPGMDGLELQKHIAKIDRNIIVIMITAFASVDTAVQALKEGAFDYVTKPIDPDELNHIVNKAVLQKTLMAENVQLKRKIDELAMLDEIVGETQQMKKVFEMVKTVAKTDATVMIRGESGTGKELIAMAIHSNSPRRYFPIVALNCGAMPEGLLESELFGHEKGAFTGAQYRKKGKIEMANGGSIFFDEIGNITPKMQMDLLRVLETKQFNRLGGNDLISVDFRVICATNRNIEKALEDKEFREDLYYRLNVFSISIPPLRERKPDIPMLAGYFIRKFAASMNKDIRGIDDSALEMMLGYDWPGNVRELRNAIERAIVVGKGPIIQPPDITFQFTNAQPKPDGDRIEDLEKFHIRRILDRTGWNISRSAEILDIDRVTLYSKIKKFGFKQ
jgi:DNA-binding NtrC family response regulator